MLSGKRILLIVTGGIAAYKALDLIRRLREQGASVRVILTKAGAEFVTPLSLAALTGDRVYSDIFSLTDEADMGHIELSRDADLLLVAPATAHTLAKMAHGLADDLASTALLATDKPVMVAPSMNVRMWDHPATHANLVTLMARDVTVIGPNEGDMACGEYGMGRMAEPLEIIEVVTAYFEQMPQPRPALRSIGPLTGFRALITSGPTHEAIDPVRYIANRSSGKQGHAIASALAKLGAQTTLVTGPVHLVDPKGVTTVHIQSAEEMLAACEAALPSDIAICAAAVADWRVAKTTDQKMKKNDGNLPQLAFAENPDILARLSAHRQRPRLVVGFAAETEKIVEHARAKLARKGCDWILANDVSPATGTFGGDDNAIYLIRADGEESWPRMSKAEVADRLAQQIADHFGNAAG
jgi:phosphopantothenoylcysteine decarboxylase/phosphopantothenate--cysteine ligase|tara:strand:- start:7609 stop:8844 length:1236 start_codon:yes stop_codon:yes gene_type:complete